MTNKIALIVAIVLGAIAIYGINAVVQRERDKIQRHMRPISVAVLKREIQPGEELTRDLVRFDRFPEKFLDSLKDAIKESDIENHIGKKFTAAVKADQILQISHFPTTYVRSQIELNDGERAISISVNFVSGLSGMLRVGNWVDVIGVFTIESPEIGKYDVCLTLAKKKLVLALDSLTQTVETTKYGGYATVTLRVNPKEAEEIAYAQQFGKIQLILRNDTESIDPKLPLSIDTYDVFREASRGKELRFGNR
jgi:pilus assembly protein CpaB